jgi:hypothetical protein
MGIGLRFGVGANDVENFVLATIGNQIGNTASDRSAFSFSDSPDLDQQTVLVTALVGIEPDNKFVAKLGIDSHDDCSISVQGLVLSEVGNGESQRIDLDEVIAYAVAEGKDKMGDELGTLDLAAVER